MRILYLDLDTLRPDHLGCYGYDRNTSPNIDRIAREGIRFDRYYCSDAPCLPSRTALMTGRFGTHTGVVGHSGTCADVRMEGPHRGFRSDLSRTTLPALLRDGCGLHTCFIGGFAERHSTFTFYSGFREIHDTGMGGRESAEDVTPTVLDWIERKGDTDNWYLHVNYWDAHTPYRAPEEFGNPFDGDPLPDWYSEEAIAEHRRLAGPHTIQDMAMYGNATDAKYPRQLGEIKDMHDVRRHIDGYDCGIAYMDRHIGMLLDALQEKGVMDDLAVIVSSDHAENQGELGVYAEHGTADDITHRIPLIVRWPGGIQGHVDRGFHYNLDLAPTLAELLGQAPAECWDGHSFAPAVLTGTECGREYLVLTQCAHVCQRSVRWDRWLYIRTWHDGYRPYFPERMLIDIEEDPHEQHNSADRRPEVCSQAELYLAEWMDQMMGSMPAGYTEDPMRIVLAEGGPCHANMMLDDYANRLRVTDRADAVATLRSRHPEKFSS